ncbi:MAG TPA: YaiI/YqxD family protein [Terriglobales bacterium]|nr:YaiI/YqxD family protein [Terriglobales bacterium]
MRIFVDADACPVKEEVYRVADRYGLGVTLVANSRMRVPDKASIELVVVGAGLDVADDWIAAAVEADDIVISTDLLLAARCLAKGAHVISNTGQLLEEENIGSLLAMRELHAELREAGTITGGPPPMHKRDRSRFLQALDGVIQRVRRRTT